MYNHLTESESEIRLLRILLTEGLPSNESGQDDEVHCEIFHTTLESAPSYKASSYTWSSPQDLHYSMSAYAEVCHELLPKREMDPSLAEHNHYMIAENKMWHKTARG